MKSDRIKNWPKVLRIGSTGSVEFRIDLTLHDAVAGTCLAVMDTKYKITDTPTSDAVAQIVAYAVARGARTGVLIYPRRLSRSFRAEAGGRAFVEEIASALPCAHMTA